MKIQVQGKYRNRSGRVVMIVRRVDSAYLYPFYDQRGVAYTADGACSTGMKWDLAEVIEEPAGEQSSDPTPPANTGDHSRSCEVRRLRKQLEAVEEAIREIRQPLLNEKPHHLVEAALRKIEAAMQRAAHR